MPSFPYQALDQNKREIRLIVLDDPELAITGPNTTLSPLKCRLITTSLNLYKELAHSPPMYEVNRLRNALARTFLKDQPYSEAFYALSYVWGDPAEQRDLEVNGKTVKIGANLHAALSSIQRNTNFRVIWADALCINQSNNAEKSWQVQQMARTYSRARATISWLGPSTEDSDLALEALLELERKGSMSSWSVQKAKRGEPPPRVLRKTLLRITGDEKLWNAIADICNRPYWSRTWIFQELACADRKYFLCGDTVAEDICHALSRLLAWETTQPEASSLRSLGPHCLSMIKSVATFKFHGNIPPDDPSYVREGTLFEMLETLSGLDATEARDKVYAPLGLAVDGHQMGIVPDYGKSIGQIFTETACSLLRQGHVEILRSAASQSNRKVQLPSWVPDWSGNLDQGQGLLFRADKGRSQSKSTLKAIPKISNHITVEGYLVGRISRIQEPCPVAALESEDVGSGETLFADWLREVEAMIVLEQDDEAGQSGAESSDSGYKIAELLSLEPKPRAAWSLLQSPYTKVYDKLTRAHSLKLLIMDLAEEAQDLPLVQSVKQIYQALEMGYRPYRMGSDAMGLLRKDRGIIGDLVVIIPGVPVPCLLRPLVTAEAAYATPPGGGYQLVGTAYVHNMMQGEFLKKKGLQPQSFTIY